MEEPPRQVVSVRRWSVGSPSSDMDGNEEKPAAQGFSLDERLESRQKAMGNESWTTGRADDDEIAELLDMLPNHGNAAAVNSHAGESRPGTRKSVLWDSAARAVTTAVTTAGAKTVDSSLRCSRRMSALPGAVVSIGNGQQKAVEARHEELVARLKLRADARGKSGRCFNIIDKTRKTRKSRAKDWEDDSDEGDFNPETVQSTGSSSANLYPGGVRSSSTDYPGGGMYVVPLSRAGSSNLQRLISGSSAASIQGPQSDYESEIGGSAGSGKGNRRVRPEWPNSHCCKGLTAHWRRAYGSYVIALSGDAPMRRMCNAATLAFALYTLVATPYTLSFTHLALPAFGILDRISMSLFILDLFLGFTTSVNDEPVKSYSRLVTRYARSGWLVVDVVAALPYEEIAYAASLSNSAETSSRQDNAFSALRLLRCVKVLKMSTLARSAQGTLLWRISNEQRALFGIVKLIATVLVSAHFFACLWWYMQRAQLGMSSDQLFLALSEGSVGTWTWAQDMWPDITREDEPFIRTYGWYLLSLHAVLMFFGGNTNNTLFMWQEKVLGSFTMATGTVVTGYIVSQVSVLMASLQASERQYVHKLSQVNVTMEKLSVPKKLRSRVMDYYSYLWDRHGTFDVRNNFNLSSELSKCLNSEVSLFTYRQMVTRIPIFKRSSPRVVQAVITSLVPEIYVAGDFIVKAGTRNSAMYFIRDGRCSVLLDDADPERAALDAGGTFMRINTLRRNQHFGELSLLADGHRATAHILADTNVDLHAFYREDFENIKRDFPELLTELVRIVEKSVYGTKKGGGLGAVHKAFNSVQMQLVRFTTCTTAEAQAIVDAVVQVHFTGDDRIVTMGEPSDGLFFIIEGSCDVSVPSLQTDGHDLVGELVAGDFFGDLSLLNDSPASAFVTARSSIVVCHVRLRFVMLSEPPSILKRLTYAVPRLCRFCTVRSMKS
jgi:CRP-like cAMP-binding protein